MPDGDDGLGSLGRRLEARAREIEEKLLGTGPSPGDDGPGSPPSLEERVASAGQGQGLRIGNVHVSMESDRGDCSWERWFDIQEWVAIGLERARRRLSSMPAFCAEPDVGAYRAEVAVPQDAPPRRIIEVAEESIVRQAIRDLAPEGGVRTDPGAVEPTRIVDVPLDIGKRATGYGRFEHVVKKPFLKTGGASREIRPEDVSQGEIGDCYLLASAASIAHTRPDLIREMITEHGDGTYTVRLHILRWPLLRRRETGIRVDERFPFRTEGMQPTPAYADFGDTKTVRVGEAEDDPDAARVKVAEIWPMLLEKAWFQRKGMYGGLVEGGRAAFVLRGLTGAPVEKHSTLRGEPERFEQILREADRKGHPTVLGTKSFRTDRQKELEDSLNLQPAHAYSLLEMGDEGATLYNPYGTDHPTRPVTPEEVCDAFMGVYVAGC